MCYYLKVHWVAGAAFMAIALMLLAPLVAVYWPLTTLLIFLHSPGYMAHQIEEHHRDRFRTYINKKMLGGREGLTTLDVLWINIAGVWGVNLIALYCCEFISPGLGLAAPYLMVVNAVNGAAAPGYSSGQALAVLDQIARETLPSGMDYAWSGLSYQEKLAGSAAVIVFALALILVYLVLAGQYESWLLPLAVIGAVPLALLGTVAVLMAVGLPNNIYVQIGLVLLIALSAKNAILIVEVARERHLAGEPIEEAAVHASLARFRPIVMTSVAFILGVVPLVLSSGAGAAARKSIGISVFSGMLSSTCLALVFVPAFFVILTRMGEKRASSSRIVDVHEERAD